MSYLIQRLIVGVSLLVLLAVFLILAQTCWALLQRLFRERRPLLFGVLAVLGLVIRLQRILTRPFWNDEYLYAAVSRNSLYDLIMVNHWLTDHPPLFLIVQHFVTSISNYPFVLRLPSLVGYGLVMLFLINILPTLFTHKITRYFWLGLVAIHPYFLGLGWDATPYTLANLISVILISLYWVFVIRRPQTVYLMLWFLLWVIGCYIENEFYLLFGVMVGSLIGLWVVERRFDDLRRLLPYLLGALVLIMPGIFFVLTHLSNFAYLAAISGISTISIWDKLTYVVLGLNLPSTFLLVPGLFLTYLIIRTSNRLKIMSLIIIIGGYYLLVRFVESLTHPLAGIKNFFPLINLVFFTTLVLGDVLWSKYKRVLSVIITLCLLCVLFATPRWFRGEYLFVDRAVNPALPELRDELKGFVDQHPNASIGIYVLRDDTRFELEYIPSMLGYGISFRNYYMYCNDLGIWCDYLTNLMILSSGSDPITKTYDYLLVVREAKRAEAVVNYCQKRKCLYFD